MVTIRQKMKVKQHLHADCTTHSRSDIRVRDVGFTIDEPLERGGTNQGPALTETAVAALVGCTNTIGHKCANALGVDIGHLEIAAVCDFDRRGVALQEEIEIPFERIEMTVTYDGTATPAEAEDVALEVEKYCAVSKLFRRAGTEVVHAWVPKAEQPGQ